MQIKNKIHSCNLPHHILLHKDVQLLDAHKIFL